MLCSKLLLSSSAKNSTLVKKLQKAPKIPAHNGFANKSHTTTCLISYKYIILNGVKITTYSHFGQE